LCRRWDSNPHEVALTGFFESDKDCAMVCDAALCGAFMSLFAGWCMFVCVLTVTRIVTIFLRLKLGTTSLILATTPSSSSALGRTRTCSLPNL
jgi:hypothetical protein